MDIQKISMPLSMVAALLVQVAIFSYYVSDQNSKINDVSKQLDQTNQTIQNIDTKKLESLDSKVDRIGNKVQQLDVALGLHIKKRIEIFPYGERPQRAMMARPSPMTAITEPKDESKTENAQSIVGPMSPINQAIGLMPKTAIVIDTEK
jgi:hypothetical protein